MQDDRLLSAPQLAERWGVSRAHVYNLMKRGLPAVKIGRCRRFRLADCEAWIAGEVPHATDAA